MAITNFNDIFWKLFRIAGGKEEPDVTRVLDSIVKSDRSKLDQYFINAIDQIAFDTQDWKRLRSFLIDLYSSHRSLITQSASISDPHSLTNSELDELFRSFGFTESHRLKGFDENPIENKVQLFLDLVNLYKIKGTPRSVLEVLQYYGIPELDIFEFWLQKEDPSTLIFKGNVITGTSINPSPVNLPYDLLTENDPHWMLTEEEILNLDSTNKINLPSKSPYFAVQPIVEIGVENAILVRLVQDQYNSWKTTGDLPPQDADITILGTTASLLELYLLTLHSFQIDNNLGTNIQKYSCYDGTNTNVSDIMTEYNDIISSNILRARYINELTPENRTAYNSTTSIAPISKWERYIDLFTRERNEHFLYNKGNNAATTVLNLINPALITSLQSLTADNTVVLQSLMKDLASWVRNNVGFGFVNLGYIFFGLAQLFEDLKPVINFFKPYRARLVVLELLQFKNQLTESIPLNDDIKDFEVELTTHDYLVGNSIPCCNEDTDSTSYVCIDTTASTYHSRDTYDCGSYFDIGAVTDLSKPIEIEIEQNICDDFKCPSGCPPDNSLVCNDVSQSVCDSLRCGNDSTPYWLDGTTRVISYPILSPDGTTYTTIDYIESAVIDKEEFCQRIKFTPNLNDPIILDSTSGYYNKSISIDCTSIVDCTSVIPLTCDNIPTVKSEVLFDTFERVENLAIGSQSINIKFPEPLIDSSYVLNVNLINENDGYLSFSIYEIIVTEKTKNGFTVLFSSPLDSVNYKLVLSANPTATLSGIDSFIQGNDTYRVNFSIPLLSDTYAITTSIINQSDISPSIYGFTIIEKDNAGFKLQLSGLIDSTSYELNWNIFDSTSFVPNGLIEIPEGTEEFDIDINPDEEDDQYMLSLSIVNTVDITPSIYSYIITKKNTNNFRVAFSSPMDSTNYFLSWAITYRDPEIYTYRQESEFRMFDTMGRFDCTYSRDIIEITMEHISQTGVIIQENDFWILQEDAVDVSDDDYGFLLE